ncbi:hypothetical protein Tco_0189756 [Tanacetum coccineum]
MVNPPQEGVKVVKPSISGANSNSRKEYSYANVTKGSVSSRGLGDNMVHVESEGTPSITLQQVHSNDFPLALLGCYKDFWAIANARSMCRSEGFLDVEFKYLGGLWVLFEFLSVEARENFLKHDGVLSWAWDSNTFTKFCNKWGEVLFVDDTDRCNRLSKRLCIKSSHSLLIFATIMVTINNVNYVIRVRELCSWTPTFLEENSENGDADSLDKYEGDGGNSDGKYDFTQKKEHVFKKTKIALDCAVGNDAHQKPLDSDPFGLDSLIKQRCGKPSVVNGSESPEFPSSFSPNSKHISNDSNSSHKLQDDNSNIQSRFSMIERLEETIRVGLALGLNMDGCEKTLASLIT